MKTDKTIGSRKILVNKGAQPADKPIWIEGPHLYKINGKYFLMSAEGGTGNWHSEVISVVILRWVSFFHGKQSDSDAKTFEF